MPKARITCRYCGQELCFQAGPEPFLIEVPCYRCRYVNVVLKDVIVLEPQGLYRRFLPGLSPPSFDPTDDSRVIGGYLHTVAGALLDDVIERVRLELPTARSSLVSVFSRREQFLQERISTSHRFDPSIERRRFPRVAGLLWSVLAHTGGLSPDVVRNFNSKGVRHFLDWFIPAAEQIVAIADYARLIRRSEMRASFDGSQFLLTATDRHGAMVESIINDKKHYANRPQIKSLEEGFSDEAQKSQQLVLGFNALEIARLGLNDFEILRSQTDVAVERNVYWIRVPRGNQELCRLISSCTMTLSRLQEFRSPLFFDLGLRVNPPMNERDAILWAAANNWSAYYPFCSMAETKGDADYVATSRGVMVLFLENLESQKNSLTDQLITAAKARGDVPLANEVDLLNQRGSRFF
jgi:hypothetical protein